MIVEQAERFGLSQLHQPRGRVGQSYCILVTGKLNEVARQRIRTLVASNDGFYKPANPPLNSSPPCQRPTPFREPRA